VLKHFFHLQEARLKQTFGQQYTPIVEIAMNKKLDGILVAALLAGGNWIIGQVKLIGVFPNPTTGEYSQQRKPKGTSGAFRTMFWLTWRGKELLPAGAGLVGNDALSN